jgi:hypothetical protein
MGRASTDQEPQRPFYSEYDRTFREMQVPKSLGASRGAPSQVAAGEIPGRSGKAGQTPFPRPQEPAVRVLLTRGEPRSVCRESTWGGREAHRGAQVGIALRGGAAHPTKAFTI